MRLTKDIKELVNRVRYCYKKGHLIWSDCRVKRLNNSIVGSLNDRGYRVVKFKGKSYKVHRIIWFLHKGKLPKEQLDHINGIKDDNRIENLREATNQENSMWRSKRKRKEKQWETI